jgi:hypothetical protein
MSNSLGSKKKAVKTQASTRIGLLNEPNVPECKPTQVWRARLIKIQMTGRYEIEIQFRTRLGKTDSLRIDAGLRSESERIRRELDSRNARLPFNKKAALAFTESLIRQVPATHFIACASPVFCDDGTGFVMPHRRYGTAAGRFIWDVENAPPEIGAIQGNLSDYTQGGPGRRRRKSGAEAACGRIDVRDPISSIQGTARPISEVAARPNRRSRHRWRADDDVVLQGTTSAGLWR